MNARMVMFQFVEEFIERSHDGCMDMCHEVELVVLEDPVVGILVEPGGRRPWG